VIRLDGVRREREDGRVDPGVLKLIPLFQGLDDEQLELVALFAAEVSVSAGKHLVDEGDYSYEFFLIQEGEAEVLRGGEQLATLGPGSFFGEMGVLEKSQRNATIIARTPMRLITLSHWDVNRLRKRMPGITEHLEKVMAARAAEAPPS
jgi:cAMP-dependent protein kinase regulator